MNLIDENEELQQEANKKKMFKIIITAIVVLLLLAIVLLIYSTTKRNNTLKLSIDGKSQSIPNGLIYMEDGKKPYTDENGNIFFSIKKLSYILGVDYYNDEYKSKGEDPTKCYIKTENEYTSFISNKSQIYKAIILEDEDDSSEGQSRSNSEPKKITEYEYFDVGDGVKNIDGEIYASQTAISLGFNVQVFYNSGKKDIKIYTLDGLSDTASKVLKNKSVYPVIGEECSYQNKKLLKYGYVLIVNSEGSYGITNYNDYKDGNNVVSCKYSDLRFCESSGNIIVTTIDEKKQGILQLDFINDKATAIIEPNYQAIKRIDEDSEIFMIKLNGKYGLVKIEGNVLTTSLRPEYQQIGIDHVFDDMQNKYLINGKYIPVELDDKWGLASKDGKMIIIPQYAGIGCDLKETGSGNGVIVLPSLVNGVDGIVFLTDANNKIYNVINVQTGAKIGLDAKEIYSSYENDKKCYYMKIESESGAALRVNIYDQFGKKVKEATGSDISESSKSTTQAAESTDNGSQVSN